MTAADPGGDAAFVEAFDSGRPEDGTFGAIRAKYLLY